MTRASHEVSIRLSAKDDASKAFFSAEESARSFSGFLSDHFVITAGEVFAAVGAAVEGLKETITLQAQEDALSRQLANIGQDYDEFVAKLKHVSDSTVSTQDIIESSSRALLLGIPANQISDLLETARVSAVATGQSVSQAFNDITTGIGRASPMILDNLGFVVSLSEVYSKHAETLGKTTEEMTKAEQSQALLTEVISQGKERTEEFGDALEGLPTTIDQAEAATEDFWDAMKRLGVAFVEGAAKGAEFADSMGEVNTKLRDAQDDARDTGAIFSNVILNTFRLMGAPAEGLRKTLELMAWSPENEELRRLERFRDYFYDLTTGAATLGTETKETGDAIETAGKQSAAAADGVEALYEAFNKLEGKEEKVKTEAEKFKETLKELGITLESDLTAKMDRYNAAIDYAWQLERAGIISRRDLAAVTRAAADETQDLTDEIEGNTRATEGSARGFDDAARSADDYAQRLSGLTGQLDQNTDAAQRNQDSQGPAFQGLTPSIGGGTFTYFTEISTGRRYTVNLDGSRNYY
jgi:hypothetical protein